MKILLPVLLFLFSCSSPPVKESPNFSPIPSFGCQKYKGKEWESCLIKLVGKLENILNEKPVLASTETNRIDSEFVEYIYEYCLGDKDLCFKVNEKKYEPTTLGLIWNATKKIGLGFAIGFVTGVTVK